ncbi:MAG: DTW domain-containing protein [Polaromonas sp.]|nr:DTW domain-containing protein [Polaromonas sp.]
MTPAPTTKRLLCTACLRPQNACICQWVTRVAHPVEVLILQHPLEVSHPKGSARLLHLSLPGSRLVTGEKFADLSTLLSEPFSPGNPAAGTRHAVLLYPETLNGTPQENTQVSQARAAQGLDSGCNSARLRLVVLDGTWRKSRKMLHCNPLLQQLPRLALTDLPASRYRVRTAHRAHQLCTLEATCAALAQLHGGSGQFAALLAAFDDWVAQQLGRQAG